jgi:hypothetical protein
MFIKVYRLDIQSVMLVLSTHLCELYCIPSNLLSDSTPPLPRPPFPVSKYSMYKQCVAGGLGGVGDHILQEFNTLYLTRFRTYKIAKPPQT